jgi:hypothetical protein
MAEEAPPWANAGWQRFGPGDRSLPQTFEVAGHICKTGISDAGQVERHLRNPHPLRGQHHRVSRADGIQVQVGQHTQPAGQPILCQASQPGYDGPQTVKCRFTGHWCWGQRNGPLRLQSRSHGAHRLPLSGEPATRIRDKFWAAF